VAARRQDVARQVVDLGDPASRAAFEQIWPIAKFPVLVDAAKGRTIPESSIIIEYLARYFPGRTSLVPADPDLARDMGANAASRSGRYTWSITAARLRRVYADLGARELVTCS